MRICSSSICALGPQACGLGGLVSDAVMNKQELELHFHVWAVVKYWLQFSSVISSVISDSLQPHGRQHARLPRPSPSPRVYANSCPLSRWCHPTISSSVVSFSSLHKSFLASRSFQMSQLFTSGGQSIGISASISVLPMDIQGWFPLRLTSWISLQSKGLSRVFSTPQFKNINSLALSIRHSPTLTSIHDRWKNHSLDERDLCGQRNVSVFQYAI